MTDEARASMRRSLERGTYLSDHLHEVPAIIIPCGYLLAVNTGIASGSSIYPAIQNLMLAARALGLGTVLTTLHRHNEGAVRELLGIPARSTRRPPGAVSASSLELGQRRGEGHLPTA